VEDGLGWYAGDKTASFDMLTRRVCWFDEEAGVECWLLVCRVKVL